MYPPQDLSELATNAGQAMDKAREMGAGVAEAGGVEGAEAAVAALEVGVGWFYDQTVMR